MPRHASRITCSRLTYSRLTYSRLTYSRLTHSRITYSRITYSRQGFTLLELVIALSLLAILVGGLSMSLGNALNAWDRGRAQAARAQEVRIAMDVLARDLRNAFLDADRPLTWFIGEDSTDGDTDVDELLLTANSRPMALYLGAAPSEEEPIRAYSDLCEIQYHVEFDADGYGGLIRREQNPPDDDPEDGGEEEILSEWVTSLNLRYFDGEDFVDDWETSEESQELPRAVEISCTFEPIDERQQALPVTYRTVVSLLRVEEASEEDEQAQMGA